MKFFEKFRYAENQLCKTSQRLFFYGSIIPLIILIISIIYYGITGTYTERELAIMGVKTSFGIFAEFMLAGLIFDCIKSTRS